MQYGDRKKKQWRYLDTWLCIQNLALVSVWPRSQFLYVSVECNRWTAFIFCCTVVIDAEQDVCCSPVVSKLRNYVTAVKCWLYTMYGFLTWRWKEENARWECIDRVFMKKTHKGAPSHAQRCGSTVPTQERQLQKDADSGLFSCPTLKLFHGFRITFKLMRWTG